MRTSGALSICIEKPERIFRHLEQCNFISIENAVVPIESKMERPFSQEILSKKPRVSVSSSNIELVCRSKWYGEIPTNPVKKREKTKNL